MTRPIAILSALDQELKHLLAAASEKESHEVAGRKVTTGLINELPVILALAGVGKVNTAVATTSLHHHFSPGVVVFSGVAGGLDPNLGVGDVVIAERTIQHDAGVLEPGGLTRYQAGHIPGFNPTDELGWAPSKELLAQALDRLTGLSLDRVAGRRPRVVRGTIITGDQYLQDAQLRDALHEELGAAAIDMEGAALAQTAGILGVDHLVIRTLSDLAGEDSIDDFKAYLSSAAVNSARVVTRILPALQPG